MNFEELAKEVEYVAVRSRGPGGQNVNKVSSAALLFWNYKLSAALSIEEKALVQAKLSNIINSENELYLRSDEFRDLQQNKSRCLEKLRELITAALHKPKTRRPSKPTRASKKRKMQAKQIKSDSKKSRQKFRY